MTNVRAAVLGVVMISGLGCSNAPSAPASLRIFATEPGQKLSPASPGTPLQVAEKKCPCRTEARASFAFAEVKPNSWSRHENKCD